MKVNVEVSCTPEEARASEVPDLRAFLAAGEAPGKTAPKGVLP